MGFALHAPCVRIERWVYCIGFGNFTCHCGFDFAFFVHIGKAQRAHIFGCSLFIGQYEIFFVLTCIAVFFFQFGVVWIGSEWAHMNGIRNNSRKIKLRVPRIVRQSVQIFVFYYFYFCLLPFVYCQFLFQLLLLRLFPSYNPNLKCQ